MASVVTYQRKGLVVSENNGRSEFAKRNCREKFDYRIALDNGVSWRCLCRLGRSRRDLTGHADDHFFDRGLFFVCPQPSAFGKGVDSQPILLPVSAVCRWPGATFAVGQDIGASPHLGEHGD